MAQYKQSTTYTRSFLMVLTSDHLTGATGKTVTVNLSKAGAAFGAAAGTITEVANGWYKIALTTGDTGTLGDLSFNCTASGCDNSDFADQVVAIDFQDATKFGMSNLDTTISSRMATFTLPTNFSSLVIDGSGRVDISKLLGTAISTPATAGIIDVNVKNIVNTAAAVDANNLLKVDVEDVRASVVNALVSGRMDSSVGAIASGAITASAIASGALARASFAADTGLQSVRSNTAAAGAASTITLDASASSVNSFYNGCLVYITGGTGVGQARIVTGYVGSTQVATVDHAWSTNPDNTSTFAVIATDLAKLDSSLQVTAASVQGNVTGTVSTLTTYTGNTPQTGDAYARLGAPAGASTAADVAAVKVDTAAVKVQTDKLAFTVANQVDSNVIDWKSTTAPAMTGDAFARLGAPAGASVSADVASVKTDTGTTIPGRLPSALVSGRMDSSVGSVASGAINRAGLAADTGLQTSRSNTAAAGTSSSITLDASASSTDNLYTGCAVYLTGGTGLGQVRVITNYVGSTQVATVDHNWATTPDNTSTFAIIPTDLAKLDSSLRPTASQVFPSNFSNLSIDGSGRVDLSKVNGSAINNLISGRVDANAQAIGSGVITNASIAADTGLQSIRSNTAQSATGSSIKLDASASSTDNFYNGCVVYVTGGTGVGQARVILSYVGSTTTATVDRAWITNPDNTSTFAILALDLPKTDSSMQVTAGSVQGNVTGSVASVTGNVGGAINGNLLGNVGGNVNGNVVGSIGSFGSGAINRASFSADSGLQSVRSNTAAAGAASTITLDASASSVNSFYNGDLILLTGGTGSGQARTITAYVGSTQVATVDRAWATNPDNTTTFAIVGTDGPKLDTSLQVTSASVQGNVTGSVASVVAAVTLAGGQLVFKKNTAYAGFMFVMVDGTDFVTPKTGLSVTATRSIDHASFAACSTPTVTEISTTGVYWIDLAAADLNGNNIMLKLTGSGAATKLIQIFTQP